MCKTLLAWIFTISLAFPVLAQDKSATLSLDGRPALGLQVPAAAKITSSNGYVNIRTTNMSLHVWAVPGAKTVDVLPRMAELIKSEFVKFNITSSMDMVVAGAPAKHVLGSGNEADDGDPGHAEVVIFMVGGRVFAGCVHGEFDDASRARAPMMTVLQSAHAPP
jgi:hypothetical protein